ncbi:MAG: hypothetical protein HY898_28720 [Deltaproteobacteria bacterium]|nr:hypothetical protein [Deltaproteobacteria bacterium]
MKRVPLHFPGWLLAALVLLAVLVAPSSASAHDLDRAMKARQLTSELEFDKAAEVLKGAPPDDTALSLELGRLLLYTTDYDRATEVLDRPDVAKTPEGARLGALARDCARSMAGALVVRDDERGVVVRMQDDHDRYLVPFIADVAKRARDTLARELGVQLPIPTRIELVRDHFALASMTGLPEQSARTTGTVAVANWGRVAMLSPRAMPEGYPWMDTLAHEMTHLAIGRGTRDRAPLWFQEGVAKREETRWRERDNCDDWPSPDSIAAVGFDKGLARDLDNLGPSIAMLPSAEHAMVAFAEVESFVKYWMREAGEGALPRVLVAMRDNDSEDVSAAIRASTGKDLSAWNTLWRAQVAQASRQLPPEISIGGAMPQDHGKAGRAMRVGGLLAERGHSGAVIKVLTPAAVVLPQEQRIRAMLGKAYVATDKQAEAWHQVEALGPSLSPFAETYALRGWMLSKRGDAAGARAAQFKAISLDPWKPAVACEMLPAPSAPQDAPRAALCEAARRWP